MVGRYVKEVGFELEVKERVSDGESGELTEGEKMW